MSSYLSMRLKQLAVVVAVVTGISVPLLMDYEARNRSLILWVESFFLIYGLWAFVFEIKRPSRDLRLIPKKLSLSFIAIAALPWDSLFFSFGPEWTALLLLTKLLFLKDLAEIQKELNRRDHVSPIFTRLIPLFIIVPLVIHVVACGWIYLGSGSAGPNEDHILEYIKAAYWTITTLSTVGYGDITAQTVPQMFYANGVMILGLMFFGYVLGNVASLLARLDSAKEEFLSHMDRIETFMNYNALPPDIKIRVRSYFRYLWETGRGFDNEEVLSKLPRKLRAEVSLVLNKDIVEKVPFLKDARQEPHFLEDVVTELRPLLAMPEEFIFHEGDPGDGMYFIRQGEVRVLSKEGRELATLTDGAFFGEGALLEDNPRSASIQASAFTDLMVLKKANFNKILARHPEFAQHVRKVFQERRAANQK